jgi:hypothetical protein
MVRHGTRNPNAKLIDKMNTRLMEIRDLILENLSKATDDISNLNLDLFRSWTSKLKDKDEKRLTHEGEDEMLLLAERLQNRFPSILSNVYSDSSIKLKFTATQRTKKSAQAFAAGLFGRNVVKDIRFPEPLTKDPILRVRRISCQTHGAMCCCSFISYVTSGGKRSAKILPQLRREESLNRASLWQRLLKQSIEDWDLVMSSI